MVNKLNILFLERGQIWSHGLPDGLRDLGHKVRMSGPVSSSSLSNLLPSFKPDLLINVGWGPDQTEQNQKRMRAFATKYKIPLIYWSTEDPNFTKTFTLPLLKRMKPDFTFTISAKTAVAFRKQGFPAAYLDFAYHPNIHKRIPPDLKYAADIAVVANAYPDVLRKYPKLYRRKSIEILIRPLLQSGKKIDFYGKNWSRMKPFIGQNIPKKHIKGPIPYKHANKVYSSAKIILGLQNYTDMVTQRTYEVVGSGGFLLTCNTPATRRLLKAGRDAAISSSPKETLKLVRYYLENDLEREKIRFAGQKNIRKHHYTNRARSMLSTLRKQGII
ncbi:glycosyltransferase [Paenibacillus sp. FSL K6-3182]|uniref:CgeB family protein n=1 Tax=Paenibacillus sp. FSL K6-3182 TaxID=2921495 RepID=UPI0030D0E104